MRHLRHLAPQALRVQVVAVLAVLAALTLTACGGDEKPATSTQQTKRIDITIEGRTIKPNGERVDVAIGQPVEFEVTADAAGEIHVHSDPEQELEYGAGTTILKLGTFDKAGIIEVESHSLDKTILQLAVK